MPSAQSKNFKALGNAARRTLWILGLSVLICLQAGCEKKAPTVDQKLVNTYTEMLIAEQMYGKDNPTVRTKRKAILDSAGYSRGQFLKKVDDILDDKDMWVPFQRAVIERLDSLIEQSNRNKAIPKRRRGED